MISWDFIVVLYKRAMKLKARVGHDFSTRGKARASQINLWWVVKEIQYQISLSPTLLVYYTITRRGIRPAWANLLGEILSQRLVCLMGLLSVQRTFFSTARCPPSTHVYRNNVPRPMKKYTEELFA